ncbi:MAG: hypothetical protein LCH46_03825 [Proteobacteria bacterium]|nr:hypothetical protein [Pseudomonadota bacterium]
MAYARFRVGVFLVEAAECETSNAEARREMTGTLNIFLNLLGNIGIRRSTGARLDLQGLSEAHLRDLNLPDDLLQRHRLRHEANEWRYRLRR